MSNKSIFALSEKINVCDLWNTRFNEYNKIFPKQNNKKTDNDSEAFSSPLHIVKTYDTKCPPIVQTIAQTLSKDSNNYILYKNCFIFKTIKKRQFSRDSCKKI
jgi:hypothetical protein